MVLWSRKDDPKGHRYPRRRGQSAFLQFRHTTLVQEDTYTKTLCVYTRDSVWTGVRPVLIVEERDLESKGRIYGGGLFIYLVTLTLR